VGVGAGEPVEAVDMFAAVLPMSGECLAGPFGQTIVPIVIRRRLDEVHRELPPHDQLLEKGGTVFGCCFGVAGRQGFDGGYLSEMQ
jgi:hypothetical protein